jgi:peptide/nickel transport system substrate-binding protein
MKRFAWRWFAVSSMLMAVLLAQAETRPQYGGILHVAMRAAPASLDPADNTQPDSFARRSVTLLMFETMTTADDSGRLHAALATSWQAIGGNQRWRLRLRRDVKFHDGSVLTPDVAAASLRDANPTWNITADADSVKIDCGSADLELPAELALPRNAIVRRNPDQKPIGTGPFQIIDWQPTKKLTLGANESYWQGRPFLDGIEIEMGRSFRDQMTALEIGREDLVEVAPEQAHRVSLESRQVASSAPMELIALIFTRDVQTPDEKLLREALALSVDRSSIRSVLLQGAGSPAGGVLPNSISGYGFVFPTGSDLARARRDREQVHAIPTWTLAYDNSDAVARLLAERVALNAKDAGLSLQPTSAATADVRLVRIALASADPWVALAQIAASAGLPAQKRDGGSVEDLYLGEQSLLATQRIIPLFHLPATYAVTAALKSWTVRSSGAWDLADSWLGSGKP